MDIQRLTFHPVHLVNTDKSLNPTALVPFCSVSGNYSAMGEKIKHVDVPVCNSFMPKIVKDQLCYTVDLNKYKEKIMVKEKVYFTFFIDYNEDREFLTNNANDTKNISMSKNRIIIETIGISYFCSHLKNCLCTLLLTISGVASPTPDYICEVPPNFETHKTKSWPLNFDF